MRTFALRARGSADVRLYFGRDPIRYCFRFFDVVPLGRAKSLFPFCSGARFEAGHLKVLASGGRRALRAFPSPLGRLVPGWPLGQFLCSFRSFS